MSRSSAATRRSSRPRINTLSVPVARPLRTFLLRTMFFECPRNFTMNTSDQSTLCRIANEAMMVVSELLTADQAHAGDLRSGLGSSRQFVREETITESLAIRLQSKFSEHVEMQLFTPAEEVRFGADWYWHFRRGNMAIHALVQAKRVRRSEFGQSDEDGLINVDWSQLQTLRAYADMKRRSMPGLQTWLASYARLKAMPPCGMVPSKCGNHGCTSCSGEVTPSIWIEQVDNLLRVYGSRRATGIRVGEIVSDSVRLDCLLPCVRDSASAAGSALGPGVRNLFLSADVPSFRRCLGTIRRDQELSAVLQGALYFHD